MSHEITWRITERLLVYSFDEVKEKRIMIETPIGVLISGNIRDVFCGYGRELLKDVVSPFVEMPVKMAKSEGKDGIGMLSPEFGTYVFLCWRHYKQFKEDIVEPEAEIEEEE